MANESYPKNTFDDQLSRPKLVTGQHSLAGLAVALGVRLSAVSDARRRGRIPDGWLLTLTLTKGVNPEWLLCGNGPVRLKEPPAPGGLYRTAAETAEQLADEAALGRLSSRALAEELLRRIAGSQPT